MSETKKFKKAVQSLLAVRMHANTSVYQKDILDEGKDVAKKIQDAIKEYGKDVDEWDTLLNFTPRSIYNIIDLLQNPERNTFKDQISQELKKEIQQMKADIDHQIADMTYEFVEEN